MDPTNEKKVILQARHASTLREASFQKRRTHFDRANGKYPAVPFTRRNFCILKCQQRKRLLESELIRKNLETFRQKSGQRSPINGTGRELCAATDEEFCMLDAK